MKTTNTSAEILIVTVLIAPFVYVGLLWHQLPAEIATHFDVHGHADGWMPKGEATLLVGIASVILYLVLRYLPSIDPKGRLQSSNYQKLRFVITLGFAAILGWMWYMAGHQANERQSYAVMLAIIGLLLAGIGNYMTTVKPNWFIGIRTPWTLQNETVWRKTHRMGGRLMVVGGLLSAVLALVVPTPYTEVSVVGVILLTSLVPVVYSYIYFQQEKAHQLN
ncbi:SdpI family protein [Spirosoma jeollabukense]